MGACCRSSALICPSPFPKLLLLLTLRWQWRTVDILLQVAVAHAHLVAICAGSHCLSNGRAAFAPLVQTHRGRSAQDCATSVVSNANLKLTDSFQFYILSAEGNVKVLYLAKSQLMPG